MRTFWQQTFRPEPITLNLDPAPGFSLVRFTRDCIITNGRIGTTGTVMELETQIALLLSDSVVWLSPHPRREPGESPREMFREIALARLRRNSGNLRFGWISKFAQSWRGD